MYKAIVDEIILKKDFFTDEIVRTIYFGGGTPSLLPAYHLESILSAIYEHYNVAPEEITLEANPEDISKQKIQEWKAIGIDRISLGIQSFFDEDLKAMNRSHDALQSFKSLDLLKECDIDNVNIDLIYGMPWSSLERFEENLKNVERYNIPHLSAYALTVEPKTILAHQIKTKKIPEVSDASASSCFLILQNWAGRTGYQHYEVSNLSLPGHRALHNSSYWSGASYLGIGPAAHSYSGSQRRWTISNNQKYIDGIKAREIPEQVEELSLADQFNEYIMTGLRTTEGITLEQVTSFGPRFKDNFDREADVLLKEGKLILAGERLLIPDTARFMSDGIASDLFYIDS